jgi:L-asparagine transporter-like permease
MYSFVFNSIHYQIGMEMALAGTHLHWLVILCHQLVQKARSCLGHQEKQHGKYHEYLSRYRNNVFLYIVHIVFNFQKFTNEVFACTTSLVPCPVFL